MLRVMAMYGALLFASLVASLSPISVKGSKLYDQDGKQFFIKGVIYMGEGELDVLVDGSQCELDAGLMKSLGVNTIRVYGADSTRDHDDCMKAFANQGIYVWLDLGPLSMRIEPKKPQWTIELFNNWTSTVDHFAGYDNVLAFTVGSSTLDNTTKGSVAAIAVKEAARDIKAFRDARGYRQIPVTYASESDEPHLSLSGQFFACGDANTTIEMFGINNYNWCGNSSSTSSGLNKIYESFQNYNIPLVFTETGCNENGNGKRDFSEVQAMLGPVFQDKFSGVIVYEWAQQANDYGVVQYSDGAQTGFPSLLDDYSALSTVFSTMKPTGISKSAYNPTETAPECPPSNIASSWALPETFKLPTISGLDIGTVTARTTILPSESSMSILPSSTSTSSVGSDGSDYQPEKEAGLSRGALIGVIVGCILAALVIIAVVVFFFIRKRRITEVTEIDRTPFATPGAVGEFQGDHDDNYHPTMDIASKTGDVVQKIELPAESVAPRQELDATQYSRDDGNAKPEIRHSTQHGYNGSYEMHGLFPQVNSTEIYELPDTSSKPQKILKQNKPS